MKTFKNKDIRKWNPCYDPSKKYSDENQKHTILSILDDENLSFEDRIWVIMRTELVSEKLMRLFAVYCARSIPQTDQRCIDAINLAERIANGEDISESAARLAAESAALLAAWSAALLAEEVAARAAAATVIAGTSVGVRSAAISTARSASWSLAEGVASAAAQAAQKEHLRKMILAGINTRDVK